MIFYEEPTAAVYCGHALKELAGLPHNSVDCIMTSPPYWGLRTYKTEPIIWGDNHCEHEWGARIVPPNAKSGKHGGTILTDKYNAAQDSVRFNLDGLGNSCLKCGAWKGELGLEPTIELYIDHLIQIFDEVKRVLKKTGTCWVNIGDSYASGKGTCFNPGGGKGSFSGHGDRKDAGAYPLDRGNISMLRAEGLLPKSLCLIPERFALGMVERGWILRNNIIWYKSNPMPESVKDRFTGTYEYVYFFTKSKKYWFEQQFEPQGDNTHSRGYGDGGPKQRQRAKEGTFVGFKESTPLTYLPAGRNKRDVWEINTEPYPEAHFATFPEKLCEIPILAGCPSAICKKCGKAREKILEQGEYQKHETETFDLERHGQSANKSKHSKPVEVIEKGYTDCGCNAGFEPGTVLDPFCGSGRALAVAKKLGRKAIGIDLNPDYCKMTLKQLQAIPIPMGLE